MTDQNDQDVQQKHEKTIADYVGDMVALESHIEEALDRQLTETQDDPEAHAAVQAWTLEKRARQVGAPVLAVLSDASPQDA